MQCPKCDASHIIEYYPAFSDEMQDELYQQGYSAIEVKHIIEQWEDEQSPTGGFCPQCQHEWLIEHNWVDEYRYAYG